MKRKKNRAPCRWNHQKINKEYEIKLKSKEPNLVVFKKFVPPDAEAYS